MMYWRLCAAAGVGICAAYGYQLSGWSGGAVGLLGAVIVVLSIEAAIRTRRSSVANARNHAAETAVRWSRTFRAGHICAARYDLSECRSCAETALCAARRICPTTCAQYTQLLVLPYTRTDAHICAPACEPVLLSAHASRRCRRGARWVVERVEARNTAR